MGDNIKFLIENNSDKNITVQARNVSVNGFMVDSSMSADVAPGKKSNDSLTISSSSMEECRIEKIADVEFSFHIFDAESWDGIVDTDIISLKTSIADSYTQEYDDSGEVIYEDDNVKIISKGISDDSSIFGKSLILYIENNSDSNLTIQTRDVSVNGFMVDPIFSPEIASGKKVIKGMTFMDSDIEENSISEFENVEMSFHIFYTDGWDTLKDTEPVIVEF